MLCTWPKGSSITLPFVYSNEIWTGIEYQVACSLIENGLVDEGLLIVRTTRKRYDGRIRNPFDEYECGHWYVRALASYGLIQAYTGIKYDKTNRTLYISSKHMNNKKTFFSTANFYGEIGMKDNKVYYKVIEGNADIDNIIVN